MESSKRVKRYRDAGLAAAGLAAVVLLSVQPSLFRLTLVVAFLCLFVFSLMNGWASVLLLASLCVVMFIEVTMETSLSEVRGLSYMNIVLGLSLLTLVLSGLRKNRRIIRPSPLNAPLLAVAGYSLISMLVTHFLGGYVLWPFPGIAPPENYFPGHTLGELLATLKTGLSPFLFFLLAFNLPESEKQVRTLLRFLAAFFILTNLVNVLGFFGLAPFITFEQSLHGVDRYFAGSYELGYRLRGTFREPNIFAAFLVLFLPLMMSAVIAARKTVARAALLAGLLAALFLLALTGSRGGLAGLSIAFISFLFLLHKIGRWGTKRSMMFLAVAALLIVLIVGMFPEIVERNIVRRIMPGDGTSLNVFSHGRLELWAYSIRQFLRHPVFGTGWMNFAPSHNNFLFILVTLGLAGFGLTAVLYYRMAAVPWKALSAERTGTRSLAMIGFLAGYFGLLGTMFFAEIGRVAFLLFLFAGLVFRYGAADGNREEDAP